MHEPALQDFVQSHSRLFVLTGAGCSTDSGIPDYRDRHGAWKRQPPVMFDAFMSDALVRRRYWARSLIGWRYFVQALPNAAHRALARLQQHGKVELLVTQNVDGLHQRSGSCAVLDLHGRVDRIRCMSCGTRMARREFQAELLRRNPAWADCDAAIAPDGDADLDSSDFASFEIPPCGHCEGILKPDVVFFGEAVPPDRVELALQALHRADAMLIVGSSLMVYSGFRFAQAAADEGKPIAAVNIGRTRADHLLALKIEQNCAQALAWVAPNEPAGQAHASKQPCFG